MAFGCKVYNSARTILRQQLSHQLHIADVAAHKDVARIIF